VEKLEEKKKEEVENKELVLTRKKKHLENLNRELVNADRQLSELRERIKLFDERVKIKQKLNSSVIKNFRLLKPNWAYEEDPEYIENLKALNNVIFKEADLNDTVQKRSLERNIDSVNKQIESLKKEKERIEKELNENE